MEPIKAIHDSFWNKDDSFQNEAEMFRNIVCTDISRNRTSIPSTFHFGVNAHRAGYQAAGDSKANINADLNSPSIAVRGCLIDSITAICGGVLPTVYFDDFQAFKREQEKTHRWTQLSMLMVSMFKSQPDNEDWPEVYWRTVIGNVSAAGKPVTSDFAFYFRCFLAAIEAYIESNSQQEFNERIPSEVSSCARQFITAVKANWSRRVLFATKRGYIGLAPPKTAQGDLICVIFGTVTPFILKKSLDADKEAYTLVGECYIHGLMKGEGLKLGEEQEIVLV